MAEDREKKEVAKLRTALSRSAVHKMKNKNE